MSIERFQHAHTLIHSVLSKKFHLSSFVYTLIALSDGLMWNEKRLPTQTELTTIEKYALSSLRVRLERIIHTLSRYEEFKN